MPPFDDWVEVFRAGLQTDSSGQEEFWSVERLDEIAQTYNPARHEAPLVIGHPEHDSPAWGWVEGVKRVGDKLLVKFNNVADEFIDMAKRGLFTKRSVAFYHPNHPHNPCYGKWYLRHVGWLGAMPPAVKGLKNVVFKDDPVISYELQDSTMNYKLIEESYMRTFEQLNAELDALTVKYNDVVAKVAALEADLNIIKDDKAVGDNDAKFAELKQAADTAKAELAKMQKKLYEQEEAAFCESLINQGKLLPSEKDYAVAELVNKRMNPQEATFGEAITTNYAAYRQMLSNRPVIVQFGDTGIGKEKDDDKPPTTKDVIAAIRKSMK